MQTGQISIQFVLWFIANTISQEKLFLPSPGPCKSFNSVIVQPLTPRRNVRNTRAQLKTHNFYLGKFQNLPVTPTRILAEPS